MRHRWTQVIAVLVLVFVVWFSISLFWPGSRKDQQASSIFVVQRGPLTISVTESGTIKNRDQVVVKNEVEGRTTILSLIPEGTYVKKGDPLIQLESSGLEDQKTRQQITVLNARAAFVRASENKAVTQSQGQSDIAKAELDRDFAELDRKKYLDVSDDPDQEDKGEYPQQVKQLEADRTIAEQELTQARDKLDWSEKLAKAGYITASELKSDELDKTRKKLNLELIEGKLELLQNYTHVRDLRQKNSDVEQAEMALDRVTRSAKADDLQADADLEAKKLERDNQESILKKIDDQIVKCNITAPVGGMVVYATTGQGNWRGNVEPLEEGQEVRERQELIHLPTTTSMMAEVKIHESSLRKIRSNMRVIITIEALPGKVFSGRVGKIGLLPDAQSAWLNPDLKVYSTEIYLDSNSSDVRPGMTCRAEIIVEQYSDAVYVPVQSVLRVGGTPTAYLVGSNGIEPRPVELGLDNNRMVRIVSGLKEGDKVLLAPPLAPSSVTETQSQPDRERILAKSQQEQDATPQTQQPGALETTAQPPPTAGNEFDPQKSPQLSAEQRRKLFENLTPEQKEQLRQRGTQRRGPRPATPPASDAQNK